jgi:hypothetical protein
MMNPNFVTHPPNNIQSNHIQSNQTHSGWY